MSAAYDRLLVETGNMSKRQTTSIWDYADELRARIAQLEADLARATNYEDQHYKRCQQLEAALTDISEGNADRCADCRCNETIAKAALAGKWSSSETMKITGPVFMIVFEDRDVSPEVFAGEQAENCARQRFKQVLDNWNASLFQRVDDGVRGTFSGGGEHGT